MNIFQFFFINIIVNSLKLLKTLLVKFKNISVINNTSIFYYDIEHFLHIKYEFLNLFRYLLH